MGAYTDGKPVHVDPLSHWGGQSLYLLAKGARTAGTRFGSTRRWQRASLSLLAPAQHFLRPHREIARIARPQPSPQRSQALGVQPLKCAGIADALAAEELDQIGQVVDRA